jgi:hypothetical protein
MYGLGNVFIRKNECILHFHCCTEKVILTFTCGTSQSPKPIRTLLRGDPLSIALASSFNISQ